MAVSYSDLSMIDRARDEVEDIRAGDLVRTGPNQYPQWRVIAVHDGKAWLRDVQSHADGVTDLIRCRKVTDG